MTPTPEPVNSWLHLRQEDPRHALPESFRARDPMGARDCGWVEQMTPFIKACASDESWVLDPFCGFGSTLVAAQLAGIPAAGVELSRARAQLARERLAGHDADPAYWPVFAGSLTEASVREALRAPDADTRQTRRFSLCLTNVPYFGCSTAPDASMTSGQLYSETYYEPYLQGLRAVFKAVQDVLEPGGWCIVMAQNLRLDGRFVPLAWDVARILAERFDLHEERLLIYDKASGPGMSPEAPGNRAHEYALIARKQPRGMDTAAAQALLGELARAGFSFRVYGSFARWAAGETGLVPNDLDLRVPPDEPAVSRLLQWLEARGFALVSWNAPLHPPMSLGALGYRHYFRATRLDASGQALQVDIALSDD